MADLIPGLPYETYREAALACETEADFRQSAFFQQWGARLEEFLQTPWIRPTRNLATPNPATDFPERPRARRSRGASANSEQASTRASSRSLRVVQWNIEKGKQLERIVQRLTEDPYLNEADVYTLNEVDIGMARSGANADVAQVLAEALGCHSVYVPSYLECTKGPEPDEQAVPGDNRRGLHGLAILSRHPILEAKVRALPHCWDYFDFFEKRFGYRQGLYARIDWAGSDVLIATTHLEVRNTPDCRARQFREFLAGVEHARRDWGAIPAILSGDWNTHTFRRGGLGNSVREFIRIVTRAPDDLDAELVRPWTREPLFTALEEAGFEYRALTDDRPTAESTLGSAEDLEILPGPIRNYVERTFGLGTRVIQMRLDWLAARGLRPLSAHSHSARTTDGIAASDHDLVSAELAP